VIGDLGLPQCLQVPINGHQRHSEHLAELGLSEWQRRSVGFHEPGEFGSIELLAKEVAIRAVPCRLLLLVMLSRKIAASINVSRQTANPIVGRSPNVFISCSWEMEQTRARPKAQTEWSMCSRKSPWASGQSPG
jgi:hypothetical protein